MFSFYPAEQVVTAKVACFRYSSHVFKECPGVKEFAETVPGKGKRHESSTPQRGFS